VSRLVVTGGKFHRYSLDGQAVPSVTTVAGVLNKPALVRWAAREAAAWATAHASELVQMGEESWRQMVATASDRVRDASMLAGTQVHTIAEALVWGEPVPDEDADGLPWSDDVRRMGEQLARFMDAHDVDPVLVEAPVFNDEQRYAGRLDLVADLRDGDRWLIDYKTGASGIWPETALQLAGYANCTHVQVGDEDQAFPEVARHGALWVRPDAWELVPLVVTDDTRRVFAACQFILQTWTRQSREDVVGAALPVPGAVA
jgi:hypothetical protein